MVYKSLSSPYAFRGVSVGTHWKRWTSSLPLFLSKQKNCWVLFQWIYFGSL